MEVYLPAGCGMPGRIASRDDGIQDAAGAMGERANSNRKEDPAARAQERCPTAYEDRSLVSPDGQYQLPIDDHAFRAAAACHDHPFLPRVVSDVVHRSAAVYGVNVLHLQLLSGFPA